MKKFICFFLVIVLIFSMVPAMAISASAVNYGSSGSVVDPLFDTASITSANAFLRNNSDFNFNFATFVNTGLNAFGLPGILSGSNFTSYSQLWFSLANSIFSVFGYGKHSSADMDRIVSNLNGKFYNLNKFTISGAQPFGPVLNRFIPSLSLSSGWVSLKEDVSYSPHIFRPYFNVTSNTGFWLVDSAGGFPYCVSDTPSSDTYTFSNYASSTISDSYLVSVSDLSNLSNQYSYMGSLKSSVFQIGNYSFIGVSQGSVNLVLCKVVNGVYYAIHSQYRNQVTTDPVPSAVDTGFNTIIGGNYALDYLNTSSKFNFNYVSEYEFQSAANNPFTSVINLDVTGSDGTVYPLLALGYGSLNDSYSINLQKGTTNIPSDSIWYYKLPNDIVNLFAVGNKQLGVPYVWGGVTPSGFDCSGLVKYVFRTSGVYQFPDYNANQIYNMCTPISFSEAKPGDLVAFTNTGASANSEKTHIGIYAGSGMMLVSPHTGDFVKYQAVAELNNRNPSFCRVPGVNSSTRNLVVMKREEAEVITDDQFNYYTDQSNNTNNNFDVGITANTNFIDEVNQTVINISGGDGFSQSGSDAITLYLDDLIYDESTKSYSSASHSAYELSNGDNYINVNYNYTYNFYIDYTSITYIGTSADANEIYNFYYELPDGRASSDLSADDLLALNTQIDVVPYNRSTDDTRLRSLYHFNGNTLDSSYWNYTTDFTWNDGASITYLDAGQNFQGALYLDELDHEFVISLPSILGNDDWTIEWRYYQTYTAAPQTDSYFSIGSYHILQFDGAHYKNLSGSTIANVSVGSWSALCLMKREGVLYFFINGVPYSLGSDSFLYNNQITFHFGSSQQTTKQIDELRVLNFANYSVSGYTPSSVEFDSNLALVLPTDTVPVADEYWDISVVNDNLLEDIYLDWWTSSDNPLIENSLYRYNYSNGISLSTGKYSLRVVDSSFSLVSNLGNQTLYRFGNDWSRFTYGGIPSDSGFISFGSSGAILNRGSWSYFGVGYSSGVNFPLGLIIPIDTVGTYTFSIVSSSGDIGSYTFTLPSQLSSYPESVLCYDDSFILDGYTIGVFGCRMSGSTSVCRGLFIQPSSDSGEFIYMCLEEGSVSTVAAERVTAIVGIPEEDLHTPTLAVRTDVDITSWSIGGVRPSIPSVGNVWALVEDGYITSLQIYDGYGWVDVDGRIWTGERFVPLRSYNIVTMNDLLDIIGNYPGYSPIYTESGFWKWLQEAWNDMIDLLTQIRDKISGSSGSDSTDDIIIDDDSSGESFNDYNNSLFGVIWRFIKNLVNTIFGGLSGLTDAVDDVSDGLLVMNPSSEVSIFNVSEELVY